MEADGLSRKNNFQTRIHILSKNSSVQSITYVTIKELLLNEILKYGTQFQPIIKKESLL